MKTSALLSLIAIGLVATAVSAATGAYFSDTETSEDNTMAAGILNLRVNNCDGICGRPVANVMDLKPCLTRYSQDITLFIENNPGRIYKRVVSVNCENNGQTEPEMAEEGGDCSDPTNTLCCPINDLHKHTWMDVELWDPRLNDGQGGWTVLVPDEEHTVADAIPDWLYLGEYKPMENIVIRQSFHLQPDVTNWAQTDKCIFSEEFYVTQINAPHPENCLNCDDPNLPSLVD